MSSRDSGAQVVRLAGLAAGLLLVLAVATAASLLHRLPPLGALSPLILATAIGIAIRNLAGPWAPAAAGQAFVLRRVLRLAIVLLGFQVSLGEIVSLGAHGLVVVLLATPATFLAIRLLGRRVGLEPKLATLLASGTSICGASAIVATNAVVHAPEEDVSYAIASVTLLGTLAMFLYPAAAPLAGLAGRDYGLWAGGSIHEVAQAAGAAFQGGRDAGHAGVVAKLLRVALLGPLILALALRGRRRGGPAGLAPFPWYLAGFAAVIAVNSLAPPPEAVAQAIAATTTFLMTMALAAMGLATHLGALVRRGLRPLAVAGAGSLFMAGLVLLLVRVTA